MAALIEDLFDRVRAETPQCPLGLIAQIYVDRLRDFCNFTRAYQAEQSDVVVLNQADYAVKLPAGEDVEALAILYMEVNTSRAHKREAAWFDRMLGAGWRSRSGDDFRYFTQLTPAAFVFPGKPTSATAGQTIYYRAAYKPKLTATSISQAFADEWGDALAAGTKAELMTMVGKAWANPKRAEVLERSYRHQRGEARIRVNNSYGEATEPRVTRFA